jgi:hypothetical protein
LLLNGCRTCPVVWYVMGMRNVGYIQFIPINLRAAIPKLNNKSPAVFRSSTEACRVLYGYKSIVLNVVGPCSMSLEYEHGDMFDCCCPIVLQIVPKMHIGPYGKSKEL